MDKQLTDADVMQGDPMAAMEEEVAKANATNAPEPIRIGDKEFSTEAEATGYIKKLEQDKVAAEAYTRGLKEASQQPVTQSQKPTEDDFLKQLEDSFFEDPAKTLRDTSKKTKDELRQELRTEILGELENQNAWKSIYQQNPELTGSRQEAFEAFVSAKARDPEWANLSISEGLQKAATHFKGILGGERVLHKNVVDMPNATASTGNVGQVPEKNEPVDFMTQLQQNRKRGKTRY